MVETALFFKLIQVTEIYFIEHPLMFPMYQLWAARSNVVWPRFPDLLSMPTITWISVVVTGTPLGEVIQYSGDVVLYCQVLLTIAVVDRILGTGSSV